MRIRQLKRHAHRRIIIWVIHHVPAILLDISVAAFCCFPAILEIHWAERVHDNAPILTNWKICSFVQRYAYLVLRPIPLTPNHNLNTHIIHDNYFWQIGIRVQVVWDYHNLLHLTNPKPLLPILSILHNNSPDHPISVKIHCQTERLRDLLKRHIPSNLCLQCAGKGSLSIVEIDWCFVQVIVEVAGALWKDWLFVGFMARAVGTAITEFSVSQKGKQLEDL